MSVRKRREYFEMGHSRDVHVETNHDYEFYDDDDDDDVFETRMEQRRLEAKQHQDRRDAKFLADGVLMRERLLSTTDVQVPGLKVNNFFDDTGWPVSTVWDARHSDRRPELSFSCMLRMMRLQPHHRLFTWHYTRKRLKMPRGPSTSSGELPICPKQCSTTNTKLIVGPAEE